MFEDDQTLSLEVALTWAVNAKNFISNYSGFSPYQLVLGQNPNLPSVLTDDLPALEDKSEQDSVALHLNASHAARKTFVKAETSERIRRALHHKVRVAEESFQLGDKIFYKRNYDNRWRGPAKIIGQDGKIVYVRHGDQLVGVSTCRLVKIGKEFHENTNFRDNKDIAQKDMEENRQRLHPVIADFEQKSIQQDSEQMVDQNQNEESLAENLDQVTTHDKQSDNLYDGSNMPKVNDRIRYRLPGEDWVVVVVTGTGGKATEKNKHYFNIRNI